MSKRNRIKRPGVRRQRASYPRQGVGGVARRSDGAPVYRDLPESVRRVNEDYIPPRRAREVV